MPPCGCHGGQFPGPHPGRLFGSSEAACRTGGDSTARRVLPPRDIRLLVTCDGKCHRHHHDQCRPMITSRVA